VSLTALTEPVHSDGAIPPGQKCFLLMQFNYSNNTVVLLVNYRYIIGGYCKGTDVCLQLGRDQSGIIGDTVAHVTSSDLRCRSVVRLLVKI